MSKRVLLPLLLLALAPGALADEAPEWKLPAVTNMAVELPVVSRAEPDTPLPPTERFVVTLGARGQIAGGTSARFAADRAATAGGALSLEDGNTTAKTLRDMKEAMRRATRDAGPLDVGGVSKVRLFVRADRRAPWVHALWLLEAAASTDVGMWRILFAVDTQKAAGGAMRLPLDLPRDRKGVAYLRLDLDAAYGEAGWRKRLRVVELSDAAGSSERRTLGSWEVDGDETLDAAAFAKALESFSAERQVRPPLVATVGMTNAAAFAVKVGDVLPLLSALGAHGARISLRPAPTITMRRDRVETVRGPFGPEVTKSSTRIRAWQGAVASALEWLQTHQSPSGAWEAAGFTGWVDGKEAGRQRPEGAGKPEYDVGVTGLALMAFLGAGYSERGKHPFERTIRSGLDWLVEVQDAEGCFGPRESPHWVYNHGAATWAMVEAYGLGGDTRYLASAQKALDFIAMCRNPYFTWRYGVKPGDNDTSVTGWMLMPIALARIVNEEAVARDRNPPFTVDEEASDGVRAWLDKMTDPDYGRVGYIQRGGSPARPQELIDKFPSEKSESMTALGITLRVYVGVDVTRNPVARRGLELLQRLPPDWNPVTGSIDMYYWYWGAMATWQAGGRAWKTWEDALDRALVSNQRKDTTRALYLGSWDPIGPWGPDGGRVYATALLAMCLETPTRYARRSGR